METKHTPRPWRFDAILKQDGSFAGSHLISVDSDKTWSIGEVYLEYNARLASAAPELLEALKWAMNTGRLTYSNRIQGQNEDWCDAVDFARAAIAKATGQ